MCTHITLLHHSKNTCIFQYEITENTENVVLYLLSMHAVILSEKEGELQTSLDTVYTYLHK